MQNINAQIFIIRDEKSNINYQKGKLLGKGGFATCFELIHKDKIFAAKCITKASTKNKDQTAKLKDEINIHKDLEHDNIVKFYYYFEDKYNLYILLEVCGNKSLSELNKRRKRITEPEVRYLSRQIARACKYLHERNIIHRDLKLANVLLDHNVNAKIADFGLASKVNEMGEKRKTKCGTPNYIAPEILLKKGHSFEADVWSLGCLIYTLLVGTPPFETSCIEHTYAKIIGNEYSIPFYLAASSNEIITKCLENDVLRRPSMEALLTMKFYQEFIPKSLPKSILTTEPKFKIVEDLESRKENVSPKDKLCTPTKDTNTIGEYIIDLKSQISLLLNTKKIIEENEDDNLFELLEKSEDPMMAPIYWISKWVDYSDRYGFGFMLSNECTGVKYNDGAIMLDTGTDETFQYVDTEGIEFLIKSSEYTEDQTKKSKLLSYFKSYMQDNLLKAGDKMVKSESEAIGRLPFMKEYCRSKVSIAMFLSNGTMQINFTADHIKLILCPVMSALTYLDQAGDCRTFSMLSLRKNGLTKDLFNRLKYVYKQCEYMESVLAGN